MKVRSTIRPQEITITANNVLIATNIQPFEEHTDGKTLSGYEYECTEYTKDEYLIQ